ncbi:MAG: ABC transporter ATP-binding protein [Pseudomonadota bacterium]|nr:ABC transporter ATP-binding protein [Pseudomonadota bacterium]
MNDAPILRLDNIHKAFGPVVANAGVSFDVREGGIHALLGEHGAGKSVLMNIVCGVLRPDQGRILFKGEPLTLGSPLEAMRHRIGMVHQHFMLVPNLTVAENYVLGHGAPLTVLNRMREIARDIEALSRRYGLDVRPDALVRDLSVGERQRVEILKILYQGIELVILDEPTAVLTPGETDRLLELLRGLVRDGKTVIFISHKLDEVMRVSDQVSVMRDGKVVFTAATAATNPRELAREMVGRDVLMDLPKRAAEPGRVVFSVTDLHCRDDQGLPAVRGVSFEVRAGEIVGIAGVSGNGQSELALALGGLIPKSQGSVQLNGEEIGGLSSRAINARSMSHIPEDRHLYGVVLPLPLTENAILQRYDRAPFAKHGLLDFKAIEAHTRDLIAHFKVRTRSLATPIQSLSGGNQQKFVVARELARNPDFLLINQLTRGIDIGATELVMQAVLEQRDKGKAILLISTELEELFALCDRILVIYEGRFTGELPPDRGRLGELGLLMAGDAAEAARLRKASEVAA